MHADVKEFLEVDLEIVHVAINRVNSDKGSTMMSWNQVHRATGHGILVRLIDHIQRGIRPGIGQRSAGISPLPTCVLCYRDRIVIPTVLREE